MGLFDKHKIFNQQVQSSDNFHPTILLSLHLCFQQRIIPFGWRIKSWLLVYIHAVFLLLFLRVLYLFVKIIKE